MLELEQVVKSFRSPDGEVWTVLDIPHFHAGAGEQFAILGPSGSGKTTLLHLIAGLIAVDSGAVRVSGVDITRLHEAARDRFRAERIGYIFQTFNLLPGFTALENVLLGVSFSGGIPDRERAVQLLDRVGLSHRLHQKPARLSVGEQQRVAVARALANRPKLVLADEPTANVDGKHQEQMMALIRETCQEAKATLAVVTHTPQVWQAFERVVRLEELNRAKPTVSSALAGVR